MATDIYQKLELDFGEELGRALEMIEGIQEESKNLIGDRMIRAIIFLSKGSIENLKRTIALARTDYRDVLWQAEYDCKEEQLYDFNKSFYELGLMQKK